MAASVYGLSGNNQVNFDGGISGVETLSPNDQLVGLGIETGVFSSQNSIAADLIKNNSIEALDPKDIVIPAPFDLEGQSEIDFGTKKILVPEGETRNGIYFKGFDNDITVKAPFKGEVLSNEIVISTTKSEIRYKILVLKTINNQGKQIVLTMTVPDGVELNPKIPLVPSSEVIEGVAVDIGEELFIMNKDEVINPGINENSIEIIALAGDKNDDSSLKQVNVDLGKDAKTGKIAILE